MNTFSDDNKEKNNQYSETIKWTIAAYAPRLFTDGLDPLFVGGISKKDLSSDYIDKKLKFLKDEWDITDKETADHLIIYLYNGGDDFEMYKAKIGALINEINDDQINEYGYDHNDDEEKKRKNILRKSASIYILQRYPEVGILGSDLARAMYLASQLYLAGIYSFEETMSISVKIAQKIQKSFNSWDDYMENVFWGIQCHFATNPYNSDSYISKRRKYYYNQKEIANGIYNINWNTPLVDEWNVPNILNYPDTIKWFNAAKALLQSSNPWTPKIYPMGLKSPSWKKTCLRMLQSSWSIYNRKSAETTIQKLLNGKVHNESFLQECKNGTTYKVRSNLFRIITENYDDKGIIAWDLYRAMYLNSVSYTVDFYTYEESLNKSLLISKKIQENFKSWDDYMNNYFLGYQYWSGDILKNPLKNAKLEKNGILNFNESGTAFRKKLFQWLKNEEDSVYDIPWNTELKREW